MVGGGWFVWPGLEVVLAPSSSISLATPQSRDHTQLQEWLGSIVHWCTRERSKADLGEQFAVPVMSLLHTFLAVLMQHDLGSVGLEVRRLEFR